MIVQQVNPNFIHQIWPKVELMLEKAIDKGAGEYSVEHLKMYLANGTQSLYVAEENGEIKGACTVAWENFPNDRVAFITAIGGRMISKPDLFEQLKTFLKANGATKLRGACNEQIARLWHQKFNLEARYIIVETAL